MTQPKLLAAFLAAAALYLTVAAPSAQAAVYNSTDIRLDTPSGLPVPRVVSLKSKKTYCRSGPTFSHPKKLTYMRQGLPLVVIAETQDHWRKIRDIEGDECWIHKSKLSSAKTALVVKDGLTLRKRPDGNAPVRARLGGGVIVRIEKTDNGWLRVTAGNTRGWAPAVAFWGAEAPAPLQYTAP